MPCKKWRSIAVVGRIPYDDEDTAIVYDNTTTVKARREFVSDMYNGTDKSRADVRRQNGVDIYIQQVLVSDSLIMPVESRRSRCCH